MHNYIQAIGFPGYYEIPGFSRYAISQSGEVINKLTRITMTASRNPAGYYNYRLAGDDGTTHTLGRHRLLGLVFKTPDSNPDGLVINHKNGIKGDDWLDNLEWSTPKGNVEHAGAMGLTEKCCPISVRDVDTGEVMKFPSIVECARYMGISKDAINYRVKSGEERIFPERKQYRASHSDAPWYIPQDVERGLMLYGTSKRVLMRNVLTGMISEFERLSDLANHLNVSPSTITLWINQPNQPVLPGFVQIKWAHDTSPWRMVNDPYLELNQYTGKKSVKVINDQTNEIRIYPSVVECAAAVGLKPTALNHRLKSNGQKVFSDGCRYGYYPY